MFTAFTRVGLALLMVVGTVTSARAGEGSFSGLGKHRRTVSTSSAEAQAKFNDGLAFLFAFNHDEAIRQFTLATQADPSCAMAWWGIAYAYGPHINFPLMLPPQVAAAWDALSRAKQVATNGTVIERDLIAALSTRYSDPAPEDRSSLDSAYALAMTSVWAKHSTDADIGALYAEAMMDLRPWNQWTTEGVAQPGTEMVLTALQQVLTLNPDHPLGLHLTIHAVEASHQPERAVPAADRLRTLTPGLGHMVHMPSHIDVRTGRWKDAIAANDRAIRADSIYKARSPEQGFYRIYMAHNFHMSAFSAMMTGQSEYAIARMDAMVKSMPADFIEAWAPVIDGFMAMPIEVRVRFGKWDEVLAWPEFPAMFPLSTTLRLSSRGIAYAALGKVDKARAEQAAFERAIKNVPAEATFGNNSAHAIIAVASALLEGEIFIAERKTKKALVALRRAVVAEDALRYDEPPDWVHPTRHVLGVTLLKAGRATEAEAVYREDLKRLPNNGWSLYGLAKALNMLDREDEAEVAEERFKEAWSEADIKITSSCICQP